VIQQILKQSFIFALIWPLLGFGQGKVGGHEVGANGDHLSAWFTALGYQLLGELKTSEASSPPSPACEFTAAELEKALSTQLVLVTTKNRAMLTNRYGEIKDVRMVTEERTGLPILLIDEETLKGLYEKQQADYRLVLHAYLLAAGKPDGEYRISGKVNWLKLFPAQPGGRSAPAKYSDPSPVFQPGAMVPLDHETLQSYTFSEPGTCYFVTYPGGAKILTYTAWLIANYRGTDGVLHPLVQSFTDFYDTDSAHLCPDLIKKVKRWKISSWKIEMFDIAQGNLQMKSAEGCLAKYIIATVGEGIRLSDGTAANAASFFSSSKAVPCP